MCEGDCDYDSHCNGDLRCGVVTAGTLPGCSGDFSSSHQYCHDPLGSLTKTYVCGVCERGYYCDGLPTNNPAQKGKYGYKASQHNASACSICPAGAFCEGAAHIERCPPGKYGNATNQSALTGCLSCPAGSYCSGNTSIAPCPQGKYSLNVGERSADACSQCPVGSFCKTNQVNACPAGYYGNVSGMITKEAACVLCEPGFFVLVDQIEWLSCWKV